MRTIALLLLVAGLVGTIGCKTQKEAKQRALKQDSLRRADSVVMANATEAQPVSANDSIRLNVSFYSPGSGINYKAAQKLDGFVTQYQTDNPGAITMYKTAWGREGEVDYCFKFNQGFESKGDSFVKQVKDLLANQDRINYKEFTTCRKPRF